VEKKTILIIVVIVIAAIIAFFIVTKWISSEVYDYMSEMTPAPPEPYAPNVTYEKNVTAHTITIMSIDGKTEELLWSNVELYNPQDMYLMKVTLPNGTIDVGDVITGCEGVIWLRWIPTGGDFIQDVFD